MSGLNRKRFIKLQQGPQSVWQDWRTDVDTIFLSSSFFFNELPVHVFCTFFYQVLGLCFCQFLRVLYILEL